MYDRLAIIDLEYWFLIATNVKTLTVILASACDIFEQN